MKGSTRDLSLAGSVPARSNLVTEWQNRASAAREELGEVGWVAKRGCSTMVTAKGGGNHDRAEVAMAAKGSWTGSSATLQGRAAKGGRGCLLEAPTPPSRLPASLAIPSATPHPSPWVQLCKEGLQKEGGGFGASR
ncbi:hypothetical protein CRG98_005298 [Punica granatum]|uniref:Uncharacterized protein n=1 Tax=Punica granatum TaxID=22663 RepID=A0A2I0L0T9_PUNGR|nr:hypothetical protein CRG98_005298 [Punica granatum]